MEAGCEPFANWYRRIAFGDHVEPRDKERRLPIAHQELQSMTIFTLSFYVLAILINNSDFLMGLLS